MILLLIMALIGIVLFEVPGLIRKKYWRELMVFSAILLSGFVLSLLPALGIKIPSLGNGLKYLIKDILHLNYK